MADSSSTNAPAAASEQDAETSEHGTPSQSMSSVQQQTCTQTDELAALREQYQLKQQEVAILQAQVERLSSVLDSSSNEQVRRGNS